MNQNAVSSQNQESFDPNRLLNVLMENLHVTDDKALCHRLNIAPGVMQHLRSRKIPLSGLLLLRMAEVGKQDVGDLRNLMGDRRKKIRLAIPGGSLSIYPSRVQKNKAFSVN
jgi:hypothetical protein